MANLGNEAKITLTILTAIVVAFIGYRFLEDLPLFQQSQVVYTYYDQVNGLTTGSYIFINGVKVGSVRDLQLVNNDSVQVRLGFNPGIEITEGAVAILKSTGLIGGKAVYIRNGNGNEKVPNKAVIEGVYQGGILDTFTEEAESIASDASESFERVNETLAQLQQIADSENQQKIDDLLSNLQQATSEISVLLDSKRQELASSIEHANNFLGNLDTLTTSNRAEIDNALASFEQTMENLEQVSGEVEQTNARLNSILLKIDNGDGTLGKIVNDSSLYNNIDSLTIELKQLIENINEEPERYLKNIELIDIF